MPAFGHELLLFWTEGGESEKVVENLLFFVGLAAEAAL